MGALNGRVATITGAGDGSGAREPALLFASEGAGRAWGPTAPGTVSPMLATADRTITGEVFPVSGELVPRYRPHAVIGDISARGRRWGRRRAARGDAPAFYP